MHARLTRSIITRTMEQTTVSVFDSDNREVIRIVTSQPVRAVHVRDGNRVGVAVGDARHRQHDLGVIDDDNDTDDDNHDDGDDDNDDDDDDDGDRGGQSSDGGSEYLPDSDASMSTNSDDLERWRAVAEEERLFNQARARREEAQRERRERERQVQVEAEEERQSPIAVYEVEGDENSEVEVVPDIYSGAEEDPLEGTYEVDNAGNLIAVHDDQWYLDQEQDVVELNERYDRV